jgi:hypothetical protein
MCRNIEGIVLTRFECATYKYGRQIFHTTFEGQTEYVNARWMESLHGFLHGIKWIMFHGHLDYLQKPPLGGRPNTKLGDHGTLNAHNSWINLFHYVWGPAWIKTHWNSFGCGRGHTWLYTWESMTTLHDFGGVLGRPLNTFFWAPTISWSQLLARVWGGPQFTPNQGLKDFKNASSRNQIIEVWPWNMTMGKCHLT